MKRRTMTTQERKQQRLRNEKMIAERKEILADKNCRIVFHSSDNRNRKELKK